MITIRIEEVYGVGDGHPLVRFLARLGVELLPVGIGDDLWMWMPQAGCRVRYVVLDIRTGILWEGGIGSQVVIFNVATPATIDKYKLTTKVLRHLFGDLEPHVRTD